MPFQDIVLNDGRKVPSIAFGSGSVNKGHDIHVYIEQAIESGFSHLDTAQFYRNEASVGKAIRDSGLAREELFVTSKWGMGRIEDVIRASLEAIGLEYLDLYLIHVPRAVDQAGGDYPGVWRQFVEARDKGLVKSIGVSNFEIEHLEKIAKGSDVRPAVNQIRLHPYNYTQNIELLKYHADHGIVTEAYGSLAPITTFPGGPVDAALDGPAKRLGITRAQVIFLWLRAKGVVIVTTSSKKERLEEYIRTGDLPPLTLQEVAAIDVAGSNGPPSPSILRTISRRVVADCQVVLKQRRAGRLGALLLLLMILGLVVFGERLRGWQRQAGAS